MRDDVIVSIICNTYNHGQYIADALNSFVRQKTTFKFEVLVHDDASTDNTALIIKSFEKKYPNIIKPIYQKENQCGKNINITYDIQIPRASGKYIAFCEGDDYWTDDNKLQLCSDFLDSHPNYGAVFHATNSIDARTNLNKNKLGLNRVEDCDYNFEDALDNRCHTSSFFIRRDLLCKRKPNYFFTLKNVGDYPLKIMLTLDSNVYYFNRVMSTYRYCSNPTSYSYKQENRYSKTRIQDYYGIIDQLKMIKKVRKYTNNNNNKIASTKTKELFYCLYSKTKNLFVYPSFHYTCYCCFLSFKMLYRKTMRIFKRH